MNNHPPTSSFYKGPTLPTHTTEPQAPTGVPPTLPAHSSAPAPMDFSSGTNNSGGAPPTLIARPKPKGTPPGLKRVSGTRENESSSLSPPDAIGVQPGSPFDVGTESPIAEMPVFDSQSPLRPGHSVIEQQLQPGQEVGELIEFEANGQRRRGRRFVILASLGKGAYGQVYRASDRKVPRYGTPPYLQVAIKVLRLDTGADEAEVRALASLSNPHVVKILGHSTLDAPEAFAGALYIVMEWIEGESLDETLMKQARPVSPAWLLEAIRQISAGMAAVHRLSIVHRDPKLANIQVDSANGAMKLIDFGLACRTYRSTLNPSGRPEPFRDGIAGTPGYIPPDIWLRGFDEHLPVTFRQDLFALAVIIYQMIVGADAHPLGLGDAYKLSSRSPAKTESEPNSRASVLSPEDKQVFAARTAACAYVPIPKAAITDDWLRQRCDELIQRALDMPRYKDMPKNKLRSFDSAGQLHQAVVDLVDSYNSRRLRREIWKWVGAVTLMVLIGASFGGRIYLHDDRAQKQRATACEQARRLTEALPSKNRLRNEVRDLRAQMTKGVGSLQESLWSLAESLWFGGSDTPSRAGTDVIDVVAHSQIQQRILIRRGEHAELWKSDGTWSVVSKLLLPPQSDSLPSNPSVIGAIFVPQSSWLVTWHNNGPYHQRIARWNSSNGQFDRWLIRGAPKDRGKAAALTRRQLGESVEHVLATPDGARLFALTAEGNVWVWQEGSDFSLLPGVDFRVLSMSISPSGRTLALAGMQGRMQLWEMPPAGALVQPIGNCTLVPKVTSAPMGAEKAALPELRHIAFDGTGQRVAIASGGWNTWVLSVQAPLGAQTATCGGVQLNECPNAATQRRPSGCPKISALSFLPKQDALLVGRSDGRITRWSLDAAEASSQSLDARHEGPVDDLAVLHNGLVLSAASDAVRAWDVLDQRPLWSRAKPQRAEAKNTAGLRARLYPRASSRDGNAMFVRLDEGWLRLDGAVESSAQTQAVPSLAQSSGCDPIALLRQTHVEPTTSDAATTCQETQLDGNARACLQLACQRAHDGDREVAACQRSLTSPSGEAQSAGSGFSCMPRIGAGL